MNSRLNLPPLAAARHISETVLRSHAHAVDQEGRFPAEAIAALKEHRLFSLPLRLNEYDADISLLADIAEILGQGCLSTAVIWGMHAQQCLILQRCANNDYLREVVSQVLSGEHLIASITTEYEKGGHLFSAFSTYEDCDGDHIRFTRKTPIVSYGEQAHFYIATIRSAASDDTDAVELVVFSRNDGERLVKGEWNPQGMRGTASIPMEFHITVPRSALISVPFNLVAKACMIPAGHLLWAAAWTGCARTLCDEFFDRCIKRNRSGDRLDELDYQRMAAARRDLDILQALIEKTEREIAPFFRTEVPLEAPTVASNILINNLKIVASEMTSALAARLAEYVGISGGYLRGSRQSFERASRDLRSAAVMYHNDRLYAANGRLSIKEHLHG